ncbi:MAG: folylpolyglutamate synthase/dihydrofolate synthase family protein [candidate division WOR-3 bacterium]|nr:folylpolyglutamate synthase/dihydrofolate synthase family protein [candidate division WOR-3 bacterium]
MNYSQAEKYLSSLVNREKTKKVKYPKSLDYFRKFLKDINNPHKKLKGFLIGGTKGKTSTSYIIDEICRSAGYSTGLFTSPHLTSYRERIKINGSPISEESFAPLIEELSKVKRNLSVFETLTALAFLLFKRKGVNYSIFEVGLGGRLDATNVFEPKVSIITSISLDHTEILGKTIQEIAREKAKIFRMNRINISAPQKVEVESILKEEVRGNVEFVKDYEVISVSEEGTVFKLSGDEFHIGPIGRFQALNASLSITACRKAGIPLDVNRINKSLSGMRIPGRFQIIRKKPYIILDGAHNVASIRVLKRAIQDVFGRTVLLVFSCLSDKDLHGMLNEIKPIVKRIYPTRIYSTRARPFEEIISTSRELNMKVAKTVGEPFIDFKKAISESTSRDIILVTGSFYLLGDILRKA